LGAVLKEEDILPVGGVSEVSEYSIESERFGFKDA
jgi:hypothetical protein